MAQLERQIHVAQQRLRALERYESHLAAGHRPAEAAIRVGVSRTTLDRWRRAYQERGFEGLVPQTHKCGRKSALDKLREAIGEEQVREILEKARALALDTQSTTLGFRMAAGDPQTPEPAAALADMTLDGRPRRSKRYLPPSIRQALRVPPAAHLRRRGSRAAALGTIWIPRHVDVLPGDVWTSDDTTPIWGWWVPWEHARGNPAYPAASCEYRYGVKLLQGQLLPIIDVASQCIITYALIARDASSYRAADIWSLFGRAFRCYGLPRLGLQFERGSWEAKLLRGEKIQIEDDDGEIWSLRAGGFRMLPANITDWHRERYGRQWPEPKTLQIWTSYLPRTKSVEAAFSRMQRLEGTLYGSLGRDQRRAPMERAVRVYGACRRGAADPRLHFLSGTELAARLSELYRWLNDEPLEGEVFRGAPKVVWETALAEHPLLQLPEEWQFLFRRDWAAATVRGGKVRVSMTDPAGKKQSEYYSAPEIFPELEGKRVLVYYDADAPQLPAQIVDPRTKRYLGAAEWIERPGMFVERSESGLDIARRYREAVTTIYADVAARAPSLRTPDEIQRRRREAAIRADTPTPDRPQPPERITSHPRTAPAQRPRFSSAIEQALDD